MGVILVLLAYTFSNAGGPVQKILRTKTAVTDIRSATVIDFTYASLLFYFKELSNIPMSTTFVFLGLIAGRELGFTLISAEKDVRRSTEITLNDVSKALIGLVISINMAVFLPFIARGLAGGGWDLTERVPTTGYGIFIIAANLLLVPAIIYLFQKKSLTRMFVLLVSLASAATAFFTLPLQ